MRDARITGYAPIPVAGVTPDQRVEVHTRSMACDGEIHTPGLGHPRIWLRINPDQTSVTCPYCSITYVLAAGAGADDHH
jgi:uncharacterized Zn-finger protein